MCGIAGEIRRPGHGQPQSHLVEAMNESQVHRGPDGEGIWMHDGVILGHRRLTILDLTDTGKQPMTGADERVALT
ncbi:MAG: hypothetical protein CL878_12295 [Dehalococcoidia bacterium]|nr:hypothetical protein [Dehalococcoidia bacterium]